MKNILSVIFVRRQNLLDQEPSYLRDTLAHLFS